MRLLPADTTAQRLGVSVRQVQRLVHAGALESVGPNRIEAASVERLARERGGHRRRAWAAETAWGAIALLAGVDVAWLGQPQRSRLRARLRDASAEELVSSCRNRATVQRFGAHRSARGRLVRHLVVAGGQGEVSGLVAADEGVVDGYVAAGDVDDLVDACALSREDAGDMDVVLRVTDFDLAIVRSIAQAGETLAAVDLATSLDPRERAAGLRVVTKRLATLT